VARKAWHLSPGLFITKRRLTDVLVEGLNHVEARRAFAGSAAVKKQRGVARRVKRNLVPLALCQPYGPAVELGGRSVGTHDAFGVILHSLVPVAEKAWAPLRLWSAVYFSYTTCLEMLIGHSIGVQA